MSVAGQSTASVSVANTTDSQSTSPVQNIHNSLLRINNLPPSPTRSQQSLNSQQQLQRHQREVAFELKPWHALVLIIFASLGLIILFYLKFYNVVREFYAIACASVLAKVIIYPFLYKSVNMYVHCIQKIHLGE